MQSSSNVLAEKHGILDKDGILFIKGILDKDDTWATKNMNGITE